MVHTILQKCVKYLPLSPFFGLSIEPEFNISEEESQTEWPDVGIKRSPNFSKSYPKTSQSRFTLKVIFIEWSQMSPNILASFVRKICCPKLQKSPNLVSLVPKHPLKSFLAPLVHTTPFLEQGKTKSFDNFLNLSVSTYLHLKIKIFLGGPYHFGLIFMTFFK